MATVKELKEKLGAALAEHEQIRRDVAGRGDSWTAEDHQNLKRAHDDVLAIEAELDAETKSAEERAKMIEKADSLAKAGESRKQRTSFAGGNTEERTTEYTSEQRSADRAVAMRGWAFNCAGLDVTEEQREAAKRCGINPFARTMPLTLFTDRYDNLQAEVRSQTVGDPTKGGYTTTGTLVSSIEYAMLNYDGVRQAADVIRTPNGNPLDWPTIDDTANQGSQVAEGGTRSAGTDIAVAKRQWNAYVYTSNIATITLELLQDSAFPWESIVGTLLSERIKRKQAVDFTTGDGAAKPMGIVTAAATGVSAASATAIVFDDLLNLEHSVDPDLRVGASFMFHDSILLALKKLKDGNANYIWKPGTVPGAPSLIDTFPYYINQAMASTIATTNVTVLFGNMKAYKIRDVNQVVVRRSDEYAWSTGKVAFVAEMRSDGNLLNPGVAPVKKLTQ